MATVNVFSLVHYPITIPVATQGSGRRTVTILTGRNQVDEDDWNKVKTASQIKSRIENGEMRASTGTKGDLTRKERGEILAPAPPSYIAGLCSKSLPIHSGLRDGSDEEYMTLEEQRAAGVL